MFKAKGIKKNFLKRALGLESKQEKVSRHLEVSAENLAHKRYDKAIAEVRAAVALEPDNGRIHYVIGLTCGEAGQKMEAVSAFENAARLEPKDAEIHTALGNAYVQVSRYVDAARIYQKVLDLKPGYPKMHFNVGMSLFGANLMEESIEEFMKILRIEPRDPQPMEALEEAYKKLNREPVGKEEILRLKALIDEGNNFIPENKWSEAEATFREALTLCPGCIAATAGLGCAYAMQNRFKEAKPLLETALAVNQECFEAQIGTSMLKISEGDFSGAVKDVAHLFGKKVKQS